MMILTSAAMALQINRSSNCCVYLALDTEREREVPRCSKMSVPIILDCYRRPVHDRSGALSLVAFVAVQMINEKDNVRSWPILMASTIIYDYWVMW